MSLLISVVRRTKIIAMPCTTWPTALERVREVSLPWTMTLEGTEVERASIYVADVVSGTAKDVLGVAQRLLQANCPPDEGSKGSIDNT